jgi:hypothetical protein
MLMEMSQALQIGYDWLCFLAYVGCMSTTRLSTFQLSRCNLLLFGSVSLLLQAKLSS